MNGHFGAGWWARCRKGVLHFSLFFVVCAALMLWGSWQNGTAAGAEGTSNPDQITREYVYDAWQDAPDVEQRITDEEGTVYLLKEISSPVPAASGIPERLFTVMAQCPITPELESQGRAAIQSMFASALSLDVGDYAGVLHIQTLTTEPVYRSVEEQVERTVVYSELVSEDVLQLLEYENFTVASDEELGATVTQSLKRVAVSWATTGFDGDGRPSQYEATVVFRGVQRQLMIDYHVATATYSGRVPAKSYDATILATYESVPATAPAPTPIIRPLTTSEPITVIETPLPLSAAAPTLFPFVVAAIVVVVMLLALLLLLYFFLYYNARLVRVSSTGTRKVLARKHLRFAKDEAVFKIDPVFEFCREGERHLITLGRRLATKAGYLVVLWGDQMILRSALKHEVDITEELILIYALDDEMGVLAQGETRVASGLLRNRGGSRGNAGGGDFHKTTGTSP
jgi:hypothetical protein